MLVETGAVVVVANVVMFSMWDSVRHSTQGSTIIIDAAEVGGELDR